jgi:DNA-binding NarL/FixJ family response regulator
MDVTDKGGFSVRILIVDDHPVFLSGLRALLDALPNAEVVGEATRGAAAIAEASRLRPDVVLMDIDMPGLSGIEATRGILRACPDTAVVILTMFEEGDAVLAAMRAGARGYLVKGASLEDISRAIDAVASGSMVFGPVVANMVADRLIRPPTANVPFPQLTNRERAVLELVANGASNTQIARELGLSIKTVRNYMSRVFAKLQVTHRTEAAVLARREGIGS